MLSALGFRNLSLKTVLILAACVVGFIFFFIAPVATLSTAMASLIILFFLPGLIKLFKFLLSFVYGLGVLFIAFTLIAGIVYLMT